MKAWALLKRGPFLLALLGLILGNCSKKKETVAPAPAAGRPVCAVQEVKVVPDCASGPALCIGSGAEAIFTAELTGPEGRPVEAEVVWRFKDAAKESPGVEAGRGHTLSSAGPRSVVFRAEGLAAGDYWIEADVPDCVDADSVPVLGLAKVTVARDQSSPAQCGRLRVRYGSRDLVNETVLGFVTLNFWAEIYTQPQLRRELRVRFFLNDRPISPERRLYQPLDDAPALDLPAHFRARLPIFLERGQFRAYYELLEGERVVCASEAVPFATR